MRRFFVLDPLKVYLDNIRGILERILAEEVNNIKQAASIIADAIISDRLIHVFGTGHSMILAEEMFLRAGGLVPINALLDKNFSIMSGVASTINERTPGLAKKLLAEYNLQEGDILIIASVSGINAVPVELAVEARKRGLKVISITSVEASKNLQPRNPLNKRLFEVSDVTIDNKVPLGDALVALPGLKQKVAPASTIAGAFIINCIVIETARLLLEKGVEPPIWVSGNVPESDEINKRYIDKLVGRVAHLGIEALLRGIGEKKVEVPEKVEGGEVSKLIIYGDIVTPYTNIRNGLIVVENGKITYVGEEEKSLEKKDYTVLDFTDHYIVPGFIDIHVHGCEGANAFDGSPQSLKAMAYNLAKHGVTAFLPTAGTLPKDMLIKIASTVSEVMASDYVGAEISGLNIEGPFLNPEKKGAMIVGFMRKPNIEEAREILEASKGSLKIMTIAPELEGALEIIRWLALHNVVPSIGHSNASYEEAVNAINNGARLVTHLFNAMRSFHHRDPGVIGAALAREDVLVEIIADGIHVDPSAVKFVINAKGADRVIIVSDATPLAGLPDGEYTFPGFPKITVKNGKATLPDGTIAGSTLTLDEALKNLIKWGIPLTHALKMLSTNAAKLLGLKKGVIKAGYDADLVILDKNLNVVSTIVNGEVVYEKKFS